jgi:anti-sigma factor RsiW
MTCSDAGPLLAAAADGLLDADRRARLDLHLAGCDGCRAALDDQRQVAEILASAVAEEVSPVFLDRVNSRIDQADDWLEVLDYRRWTLRLAPIAATLALVALLGIGIRASSTPSTSAQAASGQTSSTFTPASAADWNRDVSADALVEAALSGTNGESNAR